MDLGLNCCNFSNGQVRIWVDGCFDGGHVGHANMLRQAKALGHVLIVGIHSDAEIEQHKGCAPLFNQEERCEMVKAMKWVDEIVENVPYVTTLKILDENNCDYCAHGDDISTCANGKDTYQAVKDAKRFKTVKRTYGISTTNVIDRILHLRPNKFSSSPIISDQNQNIQSYTGDSSYLLTCSKIDSFSFSHPKNPSKCNKIVYVPGTFDILHIGHLRFLKEASEQGDYLIVGIYDDETAKSLLGEPYPIMNLSERLMSLRACKFVDDIIIGAPISVSKDLIDEFNVKLVVQCSDNLDGPTSRLADDPFAYPRQKNILRYVPSNSNMTTARVIKIVDEDRREEFLKRNADKKKKETKVIQQQAMLNADVNGNDVQNQC